VIVVIAALGFAYATPYIALNNLKRRRRCGATRKPSISMLDFPALRESLKSKSPAC